MYELTTNRDRTLPPRCHLDPFLEYFFYQQKKNLLDYSNISYNFDVPTVDKKSTGCTTKIHKENKNQKTAKGITALGECFAACTQSH